MANSFVTYAGDGTTTNFSVTFPYLEQADVSVQVSGVSASFTWVNSTTITVSPAPALNAPVRIFRTTPVTMETVFGNGTVLGQGDLNTAVKQLLFLTQEASDAASQALAFSENETLPANPLLPLKAARENTLLGFDSNGNPTAIAQNTASGNIVQATGGTTQAALAQRFGHLLNPVDDFGAAGDGTTDDTAHLTAADAAAVSAGVPLAIVGTIRVSTNTTLNSDLLFLGGKLKPDTGVTVTINGQLIGATRKQLFSGLGTIKMSVLASAPAIYPEWWGAKADGSTDCSPGINAALALTHDHDGLISLGPGVYNLNSGLVATAPFTLRGTGMGIGPSGATSGGGTILATAFANGDVLSVTCLQSVIVERLQFSSYVTRTGGAAIHISGPNPATNANSRVLNCAFLNQYDCVRFTGVAAQVVDGCYFTTWVNTGYFLDSFGTTESGGGTLSNSFFFGNNTGTGGTPQQACILLTAGYTRILSNLIVGATVGIIVNCGTGVPNAGVTIANNFIEEQTVESILLEQNTEAEVSVTITGNEFSQIVDLSSFQAHINITASTADWITDVNISGNTFNSFLTYVTAAFLSIQAGKNVVVQGNTLNNNSASANATAIAVGTQPDVPVQVLDNGLIGFSAGKFYNTSSPSKILVRDNNGIAFANLSAWANGSSVLVTDGHATNPGAGNFTLISGAASGVVATRNNGAWLTLAA